MGNEMFQARLEEDFAEKVHEYREEKHMSKSEAVRDLLRSGLAAQGHPVASADGGTLQENVEDMQREVQRARTGTLAAIAYLAVVVLAPSALPVSIVLTAVGVLLAVGLWYAGMFDLSALRGESDE